MEATTKEIAALLRSTDEMALQFSERVQARVGEPVSDTEILAAMKKIPSKSLSMQKVVTRVQQLKSASRKKAARQTPNSRPAAQRQGPASPTVVPAPRVPRKDPKTILAKLESVLAENWGRAEAEGLNPKRMSADNFVTAKFYLHVLSRVGDTVGIVNRSGDNAGGLQLQGDIQFGPIIR